MSIAIIWENHFPPDLFWHNPPLAEDGYFTLALAEESGIFISVFVITTGW